MYNMTENMEYTANKSIMVTKQLLYGIMGYIAENMEYTANKSLMVAEQLLHGIMRWIAENMVEIL